jgi:CheY-like chemotaxis protein
VPKLLEQKGHTVQVANCAERAMMLIKDKGNYEVLLLLLYLPGMDGAELCRWMDKWSAKKGVLKVAFTCPGSCVPPDLARSLPHWLPVDRFIDGLERVEDLVKAVEEVLSSRS